jgi:7-cyano-7-deazaguanine synthase in queuosine biosynthesis
MTADVNLCSGGLDSYLAWKLFVPHAENVYVRIGHRYEAREIGALAMLQHGDPAFRWASLEGPRIGHLETPSGIIPCRNALMLLVAAAHCGSRQGVTRVNLWLGALAGEINSDKSPEFCRAVEETLNVSWRAQYWTSGVAFSVSSPVRDLTKAQLVSHYADGGGDMSLLRLTRSCYDEGAREYGNAHCGECAACFKRWVAFRAAGVADPTDYMRDPREWSGADEARRKARDGTYDAVRSAETLAALQEGIA